jgi:hypothetical protein
MAAYGFGDLTVRDEQGAAWVVRTVGDVLRVPFGLRTRDIVAALPITAKRAYAVTPGTPGSGRRHRVLRAPPAGS